MLYQDGMVRARYPKLEAINTNLVSIKYNLRNLNIEDYETLCSWIKTKRALSFVSSDIAPFLTDDIIERWVNVSCQTQVVTNCSFSQILGFFTLSTLELECIPDDAIELCHLIAKPCRDIYNIGSFICSEAKQIAYSIGYKKLLGRAVKDNYFGNHLAYLNYFQFMNQSFLPKGFNWYSFNLTKLGGYHHV